jgi:C1A family cysteine protease
MPKFQLTHKKDEFDKRDSIFPLMTVGHVEVSLKDQLGPVRDQGSMGSCTGNASGGFFDWLFNTQGKYFPTPVPTGDMFSALNIYANERIMDGTFPNDVGSDSRSAFRVLSRLGACLNSQMPYDQSLAAEAPNATQITEAKNYKIGAYHRILWDAKLEGFRSVLASGYCRIIGIPVYQGIESDECAETGNLPMPKRTDTPIGGHELLVFGASDRLQVEFVRNSWGASWGQQGNLNIPYGYYDIVGGNDVLDSWTAHMGKPWKKKVA